MRLDSEAQGWMNATVQRVMARHHLAEPERAGLQYELMSHLHAAGERKAREAGREEIAAGDLQAAVLEMGGEASLVEAFVAPRAKPLPRAGLVLRTAAVLVDYIIVGLGIMAIGFFLFFMGFFAFAFSGFRGDPTDVFDLFGGRWPGLMVPLFFALVLAYFTFFEGRDGRTFGKQVFNLRVMRPNGAPITNREALLRNLVKVFPPLLVLDALFLLVFFNNEKQRVSDRLADTIVVEMT